MKNFKIFNDWLSHAVAGQNKVESTHFDCIDGWKREQFSGLELVQYTQAMLVTALMFLRSLRYEHGVKHVVMFLPVAASDEALTWNPEIWNRVDCLEEPPSFYLLRDTQIFDDESEEYRRPIAMPIENRESIRAVFRSFRNVEAIKNEWEFTSGVYLIGDVD